MSTGMDLKFRRMRARVTQERFAARAERSRSWVSRIERDDYKDPDSIKRYVSTLLTFEDVSGIPSDETSAA